MDKTLCPYCRSGITGASSNCTQCATSYHEECFKEAEGCILATCTAASFQNSQVQQNFAIPSVNSCNNCNKSLQPSDKFCTGCGTLVASPENNQTRVIANRFCTTCGKQIGTSSAFCTGCGAPAGKTVNKQELERFTDVIYEPSKNENTISTPTMPSVSESVLSPIVTNDSNKSLAEQIQALADLRTEGLLSDEEFATAKKRLLS